MSNGTGIPELDLRLLSYLPGCVFAGAGRFEGADPDPYIELGVYRNNVALSGELDERGNGLIKGELRFDGETIRAFNFRGCQLLSKQEVVSYTAYHALDGLVGKPCLIHKGGNFKDAFVFVYETSVELVSEETFVGIKIALGGLARAFFYCGISKH